MMRFRPRLRVIDGGNKNAPTYRRRAFGMVRLFNQHGEAVYLTAIMTAPALYGSIL